MKTRWYRIYDSLNNYIASRPSYKEAMMFCISRGRTDWRIL